MNNDLMSSSLNFYALVSGPVPSPFEEDDEYSPADTVPLSVVDLGVLRVPSGRVEACDPFVTLGDGPVFEVEPGDYPVRVTVADVEAYLSLVLADGEPASVEAAQPVRGRGIVCVDAGAVAFVDHDAVATAMPPQDDWYDVFDSGEPDSWFSLMDSPDHYRRGAANIVMPRAGAGENVVLSYSGWGDGVYPVMLTRDADGAPLGLHIDLGVVGEFASEDEEDDEDE
ncbi:DUF4241 domain-containing protein [Actinomyces dentalis]|uniref:DUF4241 domain-containing protein n=1 Tax=Actinomyces dentalis TaxID=272548 RepID=UPI00047B7784|nr:DUF4241 domain-containing protein [Actinomyces dentalis]